MSNLSYGRNQAPVSYFHDYPGDFRQLVENYCNALHTEASTETVSQYRQQVAKRMRDNDIAENSIGLQGYIYISNTDYLYVNGIHINGISRDPLNRLTLWSVEKKAVEESAPVANGVSLASLPDSNIGAKATYTDGYPIEKTGDAEYTITYAYNMNLQDTVYNKSKWAAFSSAMNNKIKIVQAQSEQTSSNLLVILTTWPVTSEQSAQGSPATGSRESYPKETAASSNSPELTQAQLAELKALRRDEADAYNISHPITSTKTYGQPIGTVSSLIAPAGCHYSNDDVQEAMNGEPKYSFKEAIELVLCKIDKYAKKNDTIEKNLSVDLTDAGVKAWASNKGYNLQAITGQGAGADLNSSDSNLTPDQKAKAAAQRVPTETDNVQHAILGSIGNGSEEKIFDEASYALILCEHANEQTRKDSGKPMIPVSVIVSISLARTGCKNTTIGKYNMWALPYDKTISPLKSDTDNMSAFSTMKDGMNGIIKFCRKDNVKDAVAGLKEKMSESTEDEKKAAIKNLIVKLDTINSDDTYTRAISYITKYNLFEWDSDKTVAEGGHADQTSEKNSKADSNVMGQVISAVNRIANIAQKYGIGFKITPVGADHSLVVKLPIGMTYCEPIYPDLITVGDTIPDWGAKRLILIIIMGCITLNKMQIDQH